MKFLIITQDLRTSGTSQGIIERSFLAKLRKAYPAAIIDVLYLPSYESNDDLEILPVNTIKKAVVTYKINFFKKWYNRFAFLFLNKLHAEDYIHDQYAKEISKLDYSSYNHIFIRSSGVSHEVILATHNLPILKKAIVNFHDPYPFSWYKSDSTKVNKREFIRLKKVMEVVQQAKTCCSSANYMSADLQYLYASNKKFYTLPHQFDDSVFDLSDKSKVLKKNKKISISYHGAIMFGRNAKNVLQAYKEIIEEDAVMYENTECVFRVKGDEVNDLKKMYAESKNIKILETTDFSNSSNEQIQESDIVLILENGPIYCNILVGKAPFLSEYNKPVLVVSPPKSELRNIVKNQKYIANMNEVGDIKNKLKPLIESCLLSESKHYPFDNYFSDENFLNLLEQILAN